MAMYSVKANGKSAIGRYSPELDAARNARAQLEAEIRAGLDAGEFEVYYQPIVDAAGKRVVAAEALVRWPRRPAGPIGPDAFIPAAETSGLIHRLGLFVLERACRDFLPLDGLKLSVNISPAQFRDADFEAKVAAVLADTGFPAQRLELEVTEGYLIDHPQRAASAISALKAMGLSIALDDFGTGYTSIAYLESYGFSRIKIDKSLCGRIDDPKVRVLVAGAVFLASGLDMAVTAEGVETEDQAVLLRAAGCHYFQGYLYSRPCPMADLRASGLLMVQRRRAG
ncbi:MAG: putative bifunctional diguanylate cyclase/phosphodiesterase [Asticcacaulis sp.]